MFYKVLQPFEVFTRSHEPGEWAELDDGTAVEQAQAGNIDWESGCPEPPEDDADGAV